MITKSEKSLNDVFDVEQNEVIDVEPTVIEPSVVDKDTGEISHGIVPKDKKENLPSSPFSKTEKEKKEDEEFKRDIDEDFEIARKNIKMVLSRSEELLDLSMRTVEMSEDPEAIEGTAKLLNSMSAASKHLMELTKQRQDVYMKTRTSGIISKALQDNPNSNLSINQVNQNVSFVGTPADLQKLLADMKKDEK
jgi:hypothetical protein